MSNSMRRISLVALAITFAACAADAPPAQDVASESAATAPTLADAAGLGLRNAKQPLDGLVTGGQPTQEQMSGLIDAGFGHFISLRPAGEDGAGWEDVGLAGATFARLPIRGAADLTRENVEALDRLLAETEGGEAVLYCASGNRVGALLALRAAWLQDIPAEEAIALGRAAGMTRLEGAVTELLSSGGEG